MKQAVVAHFDPLKNLETNEMTVQERSNLYLRLRAGSKSKISGTLDDKEVSELEEFLRMLNF